MTGGRLKPGDKTLSPQELLALVLGGPEKAPLHKIHSEATFPFCHLQRLDTSISSIDSDRASELVVTTHLPSVAVPLLPATHVVAAVLLPISISPSAQAPSRSASTYLCTHHTACHHQDESDRRSWKFRRTYRGSSSKESGNPLSTRARSQSRHSSLNTVPSNLNRVSATML